MLSTIVPRRRGKQNIFLPSGSKTKVSETPYPVNWTSKPNQDFECELCCILMHSLPFKKNTNLYQYSTLNLLERIDTNCLLNENLNRMLLRLTPPRKAKRLIRCDMHYNLETIRFIYTLSYTPISLSSCLKLDICSNLFHLLR